MGCGLREPSGSGKGCFSRVVCQAPPAGREGWGSGGLMGRSSLVGSVRHHAKQAASCQHINVLQLQFSHVFPRHVGRHSSLPQSLMWCITPHPTTPHTQGLTRVHCCVWQCLPAAWGQLPLLSWRGLAAHSPVQQQTLQTRPCHLTLWGDEVKGLSVEGSWIRG